MLGTYAAPEAAAEAAAESCGELQRVATVGSTQHGFYRFGCTINISKATFVSILPLVIHLPSHHVRVSSCHWQLVGVKSKRLVGG